MAKSSRGRGRFSRQEVLDALRGVEPAVEADAEDLSPDEILTKAGEALVEYDYELAHNLFKLAVLRSEGDEDAVCRLATFLVDDYAAFDEAISLLTSPSCAVNDEALLLLARSHSLAGHKAHALEAFQEVNRGKNADASSLKQEGALLLDLGRADEAVETLQKALEKDPHDAEALKLKTDAERAASAEMAPFLERAEADLLAGKLDEAGRTLGQLGDKSWRPPDYYRLSHRLDELRSRKAGSQLLDEAARREAEGDLDGALERYRQALEHGSGGVEVTDKVRQLESKVSQQAAAGLVATGTQQFESQAYSAAIQSFYSGIARDPQVREPRGEAASLFGLVHEFSSQLGRSPNSAQAQWIESLWQAIREMDQGNHDAAEMNAHRAGSLTDQLPSGRALSGRLAEERRMGAVVAAQAWIGEALALESKGALDEACLLYERAAKVEGFPGARNASTRAAAIREKERSTRELASLKAFLDGLLNESQYFRVLREIDKNRERLASAGELAEMEAAARDGVADKYPMEVTPVPGKEFGRRKEEYNSGTDQVKGFNPDSTRVAGTAPGVEEVFLVSGRNLALLDLAEIQLRLTALLPPQSDWGAKAGFFVSDLSPGDRNSLLSVNFDQDLMLHFAHKRSRLDLCNALPIERHLQQSRQKVSRWFALNGRDEQLLVCQSAPGVSNEAQLYSVSLDDGKLVHTQTHGQPLYGLRSIPGGQGTLLVHRHPEPALMRRPGYFSFALLDTRLRFTHRFHVPPEDFDGMLLETARWARLSASGRIFFFFRYFDGLTGQLTNRPLAFIAMKTDGTLLYAVTDSSQLVKNQADLDPVAELIDKDGSERMVVLGKKDGAQFLFVVELERFRAIESYRIPDNQVVVGVCRGATPGTYVTIALSKDSGEIAMRELAVP